MKIIRSFKYFDFGLQLILVIITLFPLVVGGWPLSLLGLFFLGCWQLFSALILGLGLNDKFRLLYLAAALAFLWIAYAFGFLIDMAPRGWTSILKSYFWVVMIISLIAGLQYFAYTLRRI